MRKILFVMVAALTLVACNEKEETQIRVRPTLSPKVSCCMDSEGMTMELKSDVPAIFVGAAHFLQQQEIPGYEEKTSYNRTDTNNDRYNLTQIDEYTFQITIKPFVEPGRILFAFESKVNPIDRRAIAIVACGFEFSDEYKALLERAL